MTLNYVSAFAGIGGFDLGFDQAGLRPVAQIEWDKQCQRVLDQHWPTVSKREDIADVTAADLVRHGRIDLLAGGFPCQDTSVGSPARGGVTNGGKRSGYFVNFARLLGEFGRLVEQTRPRCVVLENPDGLLSSPGRPRPGSKAYATWDGVDRTGWDMAAVARALDDLGYGWAYRVVDAREHGSVQRRNRVIIVGFLGGDPRPAGEVLGLCGPGGPAAGARADRPERGPAAGGGADEGGGTVEGVWRKVSRARASLAAGGYETWRDDGIGNTLTGFDGGSINRQQHVVVQGGRVRSLVPVEWERLQGFPDDWTAIMGEAARYKALGNAMNVDTARWLGARLRAVCEAVPAGMDWDAALAEWSTVLTV